MRPIPRAPPAGRHRRGPRYYTTVNGLSPAEPTSTDMLLLQETADRGFCTILPWRWHFPPGSPTITYTPNTPQQ